MESPPEKPKWRSEYSIVAVMGIIYIILLGLFTWIFNHSL